jgi:hypothetical protein
MFSIMRRPSSAPSFSPESAQSLAWLVIVNGHHDGVPVVPTNFFLDCRDERVDFIHDEL